jgi:hypothetical protein
MNRKRGKGNWDKGNHQGPDKEKGKPYTSPPRTKSRLDRLMRAMSMHLIALLAFAVAGPADTTNAQLRGSQRSVVRQHQVARRNDFTFLRTSKQVREFVREQRLDRVTSSKDVQVANVSFPYARPAVRMFVERLAAQYRAATGQRLVVTSLTRPISRQPRNASELSVHPAGMAVDFRIPKSPAARRWLEKTLLELEDKVVLDVTKERTPAHYHVAVFPRQYEKYLAELEGN